MSALIDEPVLDRQGLVPFLADLFARRGAEDYLGEPVSMAEHMLQAAHRAELEGGDDELVAAALLHDIGHFTSEFAYLNFDKLDNKHDQGGARVLAPFFPERMVACIRLHVAAKRYLCAVEPHYYDALSEASVHSLSLQGGPMGSAEIAAFELNPHHADAVRVRRWDDAAKVPGHVTPPFSHYAAVLDRVLSRPDERLQAAAPPR
ncbi:HD domain-containing protein [Zavarzinia sp. CC-PAN008]|uniref:HD domain-containing protein n=1 Tax=Zavarzinia sp. CC-PAN008 TaxID=3243332 RepID=UPI003F74772A